MGFRTLEISNAAEIHIKENQLKVTTEDGTASIPLEDLSVILAHGANIRLSTMDLSILAQNKVTIVTLDNRYLPTTITLPFEGNARQSKLIHAQSKCSTQKYSKIWVSIVEGKVKNQCRALSILGLEGAESIVKQMLFLNEDNVDYVESITAKRYFEIYHKGLNRRTDDPMNSRLNYGYAVVRSAIIRKLVIAGFHPAFGIHHNSQLNTFNLADDLIEPYRAIVDLIAYENVGTNSVLSKTERKNLAKALHTACVIDGMKVSVLSAIDIMVESLRRIILEETEEELKLPIVLPVEIMEAITE